MDRRRFLTTGLLAGTALALPGHLSQRAFAAALPTSIVDFSALQLSAAIHGGDVSCVEVMQAYLAHIARLNPVHNAIVGQVDDDALLAEAAAADRDLARGNDHGWMHGMPHAVKDLAAVAGLVHTQASPIYAGRIAEQDADFVARLRRAGAIFIGKTNASEFGFGSQSYNPVFGATGSAFDPALTAGGSSGGAGSALGTHMVPVADGSDQMGSLRNPGAFNNVIGFRPSAGSQSSTAPARRPLSTGGPMGRSTADTIALLQTMAPRPLPEPFAALPLNGLRIGWLGDMDGYLAMEEGILPLCEASLQSVEEAGARIEPVQPRLSPASLWECWTVLRHSGRLGMGDLYADPATRALLKPEVVWEIEQGLAATEADIARANALREDWYQEQERLFGQFDLLVMPTSQVFPFPKEIHWPTAIGSRAMDTYHRWMEVVILASVGGLPVINVPVGFDNRGRPMGMQVMGRYGDDKRVLEFGLAYEQITDHLTRRPVF
ncbi:MAG: hypothetical protein RLZZ385_1998 [Pseudomonadota bacterium]|jgi:amidase